eukprot:7655751-Pyramimonas_sp.AAC.2
MAKAGEGLGEREGEGRRTVEGEEGRRKRTVGINFSVEGGREGGGWRSMDGERRAGRRRDTR